jgi:hypothetical protein
MLKNFFKQSDSKIYKFIVLDCKIYDGYKPLNLIENTEIKNEIIKYVNSK